LPLTVPDQPEARIRALLGTALLRIPEKWNLLRASAPQFGVAGVVGDDRGDTASADRGDHIGLAHRMTGGELTLGAVPARLEEREHEITAQAETMREQVAQLTVQLDEPGRAAEEVRITRKTLLGLPDHPAYQQIMAVFTAADHPLRARQVCEAMDLAVAPNNINNVRLKLKRLAGRGILPQRRCVPPRAPKLRGALGEGVRDVKVGDEVLGWSDNDFATVAGVLKELQQRDVRA